MHKNFSFESLFMLQSYTISFNLQTIFNIFCLKNKKMTAIAVDLVTITNI